mgnify:CR=1 FL=1
MWNLENKKAIVTGGSKGIGKAVVLEFLKLGADVLFTARNKEDIVNFENELKTTYPKVKGLVSDSSSPKDRLELEKWVSSNWGLVDILVNNAGINIRKKTIDYTTEEFQKVVAINLIAPFEISRLLYPALKKSGKASVINIASAAAMQDVGTGSPYAMAKAGLLQQTRSLAVEWAKEGIRVNAVSPWFTKTPLTEGYLGQDEKISPILKRTPLNRVAEPEEMSAIVSFLAMDKSSFITGQNIIADGGMSVNAL